MIQRVSTTEGRRLLQAQAKKPHKYHAKAQVVDGVRFASRREAKRYGELRVMEQAGLISDVRRQVRFTLHAPVMMEAGSSQIGIGPVCQYVADFVYIENGAEIVEDAKGFRTPAYRQKAKHMLVEYGIQIRET